MRRTRRYADERREVSGSTLRTADTEDLPDLALQRVMGIVRVQHALFDRFIKLEALYDPNSWAANGSYSSSEKSLRRGPGSQVIENVIASNVDAITGSLASEMVRARFMTTGADWSTQRRAKELEYWTDALDADLELDVKCRETAREGAKKGTGIVVVDDGPWDEIYATTPLIDDCIVDEGALQPDGWPLEFYLRHRIDRDLLAAMYPKHAKHILREHDGRESLYASAWSRWMDDGRLQRNQVGMLEGWILPVGRKGRAGYKVGRHFRMIPGRVVFEREWDEPYFPISRFVWVPRRGCWYGISGGERIAGHQRRLNKMSWQFDRKLDQGALPITYVDPADENIGVVTHSELGTVAVSRGARPPLTVVPSVISSEEVERHRQIREGSFEEFGQSRLSATAMKPSGIDSGAALREYKDQTTDRFAGQEKDLEQLKLGCVILGICAARRLGRKAPSYYRKSFSRGTRRIRFSDVDPREARIQIAAASKLARTPAGRKQFALELAQAGVITTDESRQLLEHEDLEAALSLYTTMRSNIERLLEDALDGIPVMPSPFMNLAMCAWLGQSYLNQAEENGAPEEVLEILRQFTVTAAYMLSMQNAGGMQPIAGALPPAPDGGPADPMPPGMMPPGALPPGPAAPLALPPGPPGVGTPAAALSPQAAQPVV